MARKKISKNRGSKKNTEQITINKTTLWQMASGILAVALVAVILIAFTGDEVISPEEDVVLEPSREINLEVLHILGDEDAPVVFVEYSSFTCPFCARFNQETYPQILENYVGTGQVLYVYKHFPMNEMDLIISNYAECAGEQNLFFEFKDAVYDNQQSIGQPGFFENLARDLSLDADEWQACAEEGKYVEAIISSRNEALEAGIQGAPGFVINGETFARGAQPYGVFEQVIEQALQN